MGQAGQGVRVSQSRTRALEEGDGGQTSLFERGVSQAVEQPIASAGSVQHQLQRSTDVMAEEDRMEPRFATEDWTVFGLMLVASAGIGVYSCMRGSGRSTQEYLLGGRMMAPVPVAFSLVGGVISAISIIGTSTEVYYYGTQLSIIILGSIPGMAFICKVTLPIFYQLGIVSLNEYLQVRYGSQALRQLGTCLQLCYSTLYMGICMYAPSLALSAVTNLSTNTSMLLLASVTTFYITIGGVRAVVYTDVLQTVMMFTGVVVVTAMCCVNLGGLGNLWTIADHGQRLQFFNMNPSPYIRHTFWSCFVLGFFLMIDYVGICQHTFQRFISVSKLSTSEGLGWFFLGGISVMWLLNFFAGLAAYAMYSQCDPFTLGKINKPDQIFPYLVTDKFSFLPGLTGVFVSSLYGGVLSSLSSSGSSAACLVWEDFLKHRPYFSRLTDRQATNVIKLLTVLTGLVALGSGMLIGGLGTIFLVAHTVLSVITGPRSGLFLSGILLPWVNAKGALVGFLVSILCSCWLVMGKFLWGAAPTMLPLSVYGCINTTSIINTTVTVFTSTTISSHTIFNATTTTPRDESATTSTSVYDVSYCYVGMGGLLLMMLVASIVSLATGPTPPKDLVEGVVNPLCRRLYQRAWCYFHKPASSPREKEQARDGEVDVMISDPAESSLHRPKL
ncbi:hypothetical protein Pcinc_019983 [Petrolisthes cinctipes]|uniref:Sodium-coupled monocarboxylate transporter 1 n=1 Tax=Petrolisthes cinctipes TaxID=88211 RepID=A0AAE1FJ43_PETCI|nr:hypothetical protein Pcinc_019983 [Petrolisthes cinctipes]